MASILKLGPGKSGGPLGIPSSLIERVSLSANMRSIRLPAGEIELISGSKEGTIEVGTEIAANTRCLIHLPAVISPRRYDILVSYNPELLRYGNVSCPAILTPEDGDKLFLGFQAAKKTDLSQLSYVFELFMID